MGEVGDDTGGLKREFFRLLTRAISDTYLTPAGCVQHNSVALQVKMHTFFNVFFCFWLQNNVYRQLGELVAASVAQGSSLV